MELWGGSGNFWRLSLTGIVESLGTYSGMAYLIPGPFSRLCFSFLVILTAALSLCALPVTKFCFTEDPQWWMETNDHGLKPLWLWAKSNLLCFKLISLDMFVRTMEHWMKVYPSVCLSILSICVSIYYQISQNQYLWVLFNIQFIAKFSWFSSRCVFLLAYLKQSLNKIQMCIRLYLVTHCF